MKLDSIKTFSIAFVLLFTFTSCVKEIHYQNGGKKIKGNKEITIENREISADFNKIKKSGFTNLILEEGKQNGKIELEGESNLLEYIETKVKGSTLYIGTKKNISIKAHQNIVLKLPVENLIALASAGSGDISTTGKLHAKKFSINQAGSSDLNLDLETDLLKINMAGSGDIKLSGKSKNLEVSKTGSGDLFAFNFLVENAKINSTGSGDAEIYVEDKLSISKTGSGDIFYKGNVEDVKTSSTGSGKVVEKN